MKVRWIAVAMLSAPLLIPTQLVSIARAQEDTQATRLKNFSKTMANEWHHAQNGDVYQFKSDGSYVFKAGAAKQKQGLVSHSGTWKVSDWFKPADDSVDSQAVLHLSILSRMTYKKGKYSRLDNRRNFSVPVLFTEADGQIIINGLSYWLKGVEPA